MKTKFAILLLASAVAVSNGLIISCNFSPMSFYINGGMNAQLYTCQATITEDGSDDITSLTGTHTGGMTNANVQGFYLGFNYAQTFDKLPSNLATFFPNLVAIAVDNSRLKTLTKADLAPFPNLYYFSAEMNLIRVLEGDVFSYNPYLQYLNLGYNTIQYVGAGFLSTNTALTEIRFILNRCMGQNNFMRIGPDYTAADYISDINFLCGPDDSSSGNPFGDSCPGNCSASAAAIEALLSDVEATFSEPCWIRLMNIIKTWFHL